MEFDVQITSAPIPGQAPPVAAGAVGAWVEFRGLVRGEEADAPIAALEYEAYRPMAEQQMQRILGELARDCPGLAARVIHRVGVVPVGEAAIYVGIAGRHRAEAFALLARFMDRLKQDVPIWKVRAISPPSSPARFTPGAEPSGRTPAKLPPDADRVRALVREHCPPLPSERVFLAEAAGRVLREQVCAPEDQPALDRSAVDGFAIRCDEATTRLRIVDRLRAGEWKPQVLQPGEAVQIATGAALPGAGLRVVMKEDVDVAGDTVTLRRSDGPEHIRRRGEDARAGQGLVPAGTVLRPGTLGLLASVGVVRPLVTRRPRVVHLVTGNEIVPPDQAPGPGQVRDANSTLVRTFLAPWGVEARQERLPEDEALVRAAIQQGTEESDLLLVSGGASVGEHDFTRRLLEACGFTVLVSRTAARPGKPLIVAERCGALAFGLPGNPLAHFVCLNLYVRAALEAGAGTTRPRTFQTGFQGADIPGAVESTEVFWPATWRLQDGRALVSPLRWRSSGDLTALASANALVRVSGASDSRSGGSRVEFLDTSPEV